MTNFDFLYYNLIKYNREDNQISILHREIK